MNVSYEDKEARKRRVADHEFMPKSERWALVTCVALTVIGTLAFLITLADSL